MTETGSLSRTYRYSKHLGFVPLIAISGAAYGGLLLTHLRSGTLTHEIVPISITLYLIAFVAYLGALIWTEYRRGIPAAYLWGGAVGFRLLLILTDPTLSTDVYRYLWDGFVANNGISPYAFPIESSQLDHLDLPIRALANHTWMASPYLPAAQALFRSVTALTPLQPIYMQMIMATLDLMNGLLIIALLGIAGLPGYRALIYLWSPLAIVETAHGAHVDAWMIFLSLAALYLVLRQPRTRFDPVAATWLAPTLLALATLTKLLPALLLPVLFWRWRWRSLLAYGALLVLLLAPAGIEAGWGLSGPLDGHGLFGALRIYGDRWNFNSGIFYWLEGALADPAATDHSLEIANRYAKQIVGSGLLLVLLGVWWLARSRTTACSQLRLMAASIIGYALLTTTLHPWYLLMLLALLPFLTPARDESKTLWLLVAPWIYLSGAIFTSYYTYVNPLDLREYPWVRQVEWLPTLALLLFAAGFIFVRKRSTQSR